MKRLFYHRVVNLTGCLASLLLCSQGVEVLAPASTALVFNNLLVSRNGSLPLVRAKYQLGYRGLHGYLCDLVIHYLDPLG